MKAYKSDKVEIRGRMFAVCSHGDCSEHTLWDYPVCWKHLTDKEKIDFVERVKQRIREQKEFIEIALSNADLRNIDFSRVNFKGAFLEGCNFENSNFTDASFEDCFLARTNLDNANLERTNLHGAVFTFASLWNSKLLAYSIKHNPVNLQEENFKGFLQSKTAKIYEDKPQFAEHTYRELKRYFSEKGDYDSASWAAFKERNMQKNGLFENKQFFSWLLLIFWGVSCGYGERPKRIVLFCITLILFFGLIYQSNNLTFYVDSKLPTNLLDTMLVSFATFSTYSFPDIAFKPCILSRFLVSLEAFCGIFAAGLFVFTLTKKYAAR